MSSTSGSTDPLYKSEEIWLFVINGSLLGFFTFQLYNLYFTYSHSLSQFSNLRIKFIFQVSGWICSLLFTICSRDYYGFNNVLPQFFGGWCLTIILCIELFNAMLVIYHSLAVQYKMNHLKSPSVLKYLLITLCILDFILYSLFLALFQVKNEEKYALLIALYSALVFIIIMLAGAISVIKLTMKVSHIMRNNKVSPRVMEQRDLNITMNNAEQYQTNNGIHHAVTNPHSHSELLSDRKHPMTKSHSLGANANRFQLNVEEAMQNLKRLHRFAFGGLILLLVGTIITLNYAIPKLNDWNSAGIRFDRTVYSAYTPLYTEIAVLFLIAWYCSTDQYWLIRFPCFYRFLYVQRLLQKCAEIYGIDSMVNGSINSSNSLAAVKHSLKLQPSVLKSKVVHPLSINGFMKAVEENIINRTNEGHITNIQGHDLVLKTGTSKYFLGTSSASNKKTELIKGNLTARSKETAVLRHHPNEIV